MIPAFAVILAYLIGGIPFGYLLVRATTGKDVRGLGSGNIGATNVLRTTGRGPAVGVLLLDMAKGYLAVWLASRLTGGSIMWMSLAAAAVMLGHCYPVFLKFQGGKAVACFIGAFLLLAPWPLLAVLLLFAIVVAETRHISLGSIVAAGLFPLAVWLIEHPPAPLLLVSIFAGVLIVYRHKTNLQRIHAGNENVFRF
ncbi:MAG TPA: glycerol-3-phosphate 1-O-acyltransferase PlsY [Bryobacteraceae bacterium]|nr:glycerol-3-phosphate 1-O-acyltransferase PlsY [Bryobacteraceae bacterium]